jgi:hypothetical protein
MKEKHLVVTSHRWDSRTKLNNEIKAIKALAGIECEIVMKYDLSIKKPEIKDGRITHEWFEENISGYAKAKGFTHAKFIFSMEEGNRWGLKSGLHGSNVRDKDHFGEAWIRANERSVRRYDDGTRRNRYVQVFCHEDGHEYKNQGFTNLLIHDYDYKSTINRLEEFYQTLKFSLQQKNIVLRVRIFDMIKKVLELISQKKTVTPLTSEFWNNTSQDYGVVNNIYKKTGHHIGTDFPCPTGTPIVARADGELISAEYGDVTGAYCIFEFEWNGRKYQERYLHLSATWPLGSYKQGETIAETGNTGMSTGPHLHVDTFKDEVRLDIINKSNWKELTIDPTSI